MAWYYKDGDQELGPVNKTQLQQLIKTHQIGGQTLVRGENSKQWQPLVELVRGKVPGNPVSPPLAHASAAESAAPKPQSSEMPEGMDAPSSPPPVDDAPPVAAHAAPPPDKTREMPFQFSGSGGEYFKIWIVNIVLSILTLGIYSAWAKVRRKQYFYGNTGVNSASFQYLADPVKILKGRIVVFLGFVAYWLVNLFYPMIAIVFILAFLPALPWFVVRALSFNARNSAMRNIRFNFHGTYFEAAKVFLFWPILMPFTLGIIAPYVFYRQKKFIVENSAYGTTRFAFRATAKDYYHMVFKLLIPLVLCILVAVVAGFLFPPVVVAVVVVFYLYAMAYFAVKSSNLLYNSSTLSGHGFNATMAIKEFVVIVVTNTLATAMTLGFFHPFAQVRAYRYKIGQLALVSGGGLDQFVAAEQQNVGALGDEMSDFMDFDLGI